MQNSKLNSQLIWIIISLFIILYLLFAIKMATSVINGSISEGSL